MEVEKPKFNTKTGLLTSYALACGYQEKDVKGDLITSFYKEGGVYHVMQFNTDTRQREFWDVFDTLPEARKRYKEAIKESR